MEYLSLNSYNDAAKGQNNLVKSTIVGSKDRKLNSYVSIPGCLLEHLLKKDDLSIAEKLYCLSILPLSIIEISQGRSGSVALPSTEWRRRLNCSKAQIFNLQKSLEQKGYFKILKEKNNKNQNKRNLIDLTLPDQDLNYLLKKDNKSHADQNFSIIKENPISYLIKSKLFIQINYHLLKFIIANSSLSNFSKIVYLYLYMKSYKACNSKSVRGKNSLDIMLNYKDTYSELNCDKSSLSKAIVNLKEIGLIKCKNLRQKSGEVINDRSDKSLWHIYLNLDHSNLYDLNECFSGEKTDENHDHNQTLKYKKIDHKVVKFSPYNSKYIILNNKDNIDTQPSEKKSNLSKSFDNKSDNKTENIDQINNNKNKKTNQHEKNILNLNNIKLINEEDAETLRQKSGRNFSLNFMNQLLLKLKKIRAGCVFQHKNKFISYFAKILKHEKREEEKVNNSSYQLKFNIDNQTDETKKYQAMQFENKKIESYLNAVENSQGTNPFDQLKRKIAGFIESKIAYELLVNLRNCIQISNETIMFKLSNLINNFTEYEQTRVVSILKSIYGNQINNLVLSANETSNETSNEKDIALKDDELLENIIDENCIWGKIRKELVQIYSINVDKNLFSTLEFKEDTNSKEIALVARSTFMRDLINRDYYSGIERICNKIGWTLIDKVRVKAMRENII